MKNHNRHWQLDDDIALWDMMTKLSRRRIARKLGRSLGSVNMRLWRMGYRVRRSQIGYTEISEMLGITESAIQYRLHTDNPIPHHDTKPYKRFYRNEIEAWLNRGNVLTFERDRLHPDFQRMYDIHRAQYYTLSELIAIDSALNLFSICSANRTRLPPVAINARPMAVYYRREDVWQLLYRFGHRIPKTKDRYIEAIRHAWESEWVRKSDIASRTSHKHVWKLAKLCPSTTRYAIRRRDVYDIYMRMGYPNHAAHYNEKPISYMELISQIK